MYNERAVSDVIAVILMISIVALSIGVISVFLYSNVSIHQIPELDISYSVSSTTPHYLFMYHQRGDSLPSSNTIFQIITDDELLIDISDSLQIKKTNEEDWEDWKIENEIFFTIGDVLRYELDPTWSHITVVLKYKELDADILIEKIIIGL